MLMAGELGLPGLLLFGTFLVAAVIAALRARRLGPSAAGLVAGALAFAGYWLVHASVEWFWSYPSLTLPAAFVLGAACAPGLLRPDGWLSIPWRRGLALGAVLTALALTPFYFSERYTNDALRTWQADLAGAYDELSRAADLNPLSDRPLATEAVIAEEAGEPQRALAALSEAQSRQPDEWTLYYLEARVLAEFDPAGARRALVEARELNPKGPEIAELEEEIAAP
jgi:tetratricopeptide (TPR) repeat protein